MENEGRIREKYVASLKLCLRKIVDTIVMNALEPEGVSLKQGHS